jgi:hypothetical protein
MRTYYKVEGKNGEVIVMENNGIISFVPDDEGNPDYQRYLNPQAEQSTPNLS